MLTIFYFHITLYYWDFVNYRAPEVRRIWVTQIKRGTWGGKPLNGLLKLKGFFVTLKVEKSFLAIHGLVSGTM